MEINTVKKEGNTPTLCFEFYITVIDHNLACQGAWSGTLRAWLHPVLGQKMKFDGSYMRQIKKQNRSFS